MSLLDQAPRLTDAEAADLVREVYGLDGSASPLPSERDQNFAVTTASDDRFVLKIANASESADLLEAQNAALAHLALTGLCARIVTALDGREIARVSNADGRVHLVRLLTWLPGQPLATATVVSGRLFEQVGRAIGTIDRALASFDHPTIHREFYWDLANGPRTLHELGPLVAAPDLRVLVTEIALRFERDTSPLLAQLRRSAIHNDANDYNVLVAGNDVTGIVDFGDMVHGWMVGDLAIAIAYAALDRPNPMGAAVAVQRGYESVNPLTGVERAALFGLVRLRLAMSVCIAAVQQRDRPGDPYLVVSQEPIRRTLPLLMDAVSA
jgi:Ser/Thr protein kinase RdoA (MazF antagonist)